MSSAGNPLNGLTAGICDSLAARRRKKADLGTRASLRLRVWAPAAQRQLFLPVATIIITVGQADFVDECIMRV